MNTYRVDRASTKASPCGMNSIIYIGDSRTAALRAFAHALPGISAWSRPDPTYGVILSRWNAHTFDYEVIDSKEPPAGPFPAHTFMPHIQRG